ncbi:SymE family type I addiction module toxin [Vibrio spartinae]|uniref:Endoribonuclease SymE n=1 Tax=Vibrio spartinae TaxID=1918945 RepID=A0ABX6R5P3_9VIBR|nr:SymE family type I addiction module toxin [Vibrio spartinae]QMV16762.1 Putative endoribonuclease SymE [Vibrio spartinae]
MFRFFSTGRCLKAGSGQRSKQSKIQSSFGSFSCVKRNWSACTTSRLDLKDQLRTIRYHASWDLPEKTTSGENPHGDTSTPDIHLKGKWLREAGFETGTPVTVKIAGDCIVLIPDSPQEQALREQLAQLKAALG